MKRSQFGEDEIIETILGEIGQGTKVFCDVGARLLYSNAAYWLEDHGWIGVLIEKGEASAKELREVLGGRAKVINVAATIENINDLVPLDTQVLSLDIDSDDWWVWANLRVKPPLVVVETNPVPGLFVPSYKGTFKARYGMSVDAAVMLGTAKGYDYLGRNVVNAFFARRGTCGYRLPPETRHCGIPAQTDTNVF
jgi:hypothetical protein